MAFRLSYIAVEAYRGFRRNLLLAISMVIIVAISLTLFGIALLAGKQVSLFGGYWSDKIEVSVFLAPKVPAEQRDEIRRQLESQPVVERVYYESEEDAYTRFRDQFKDSPDMVRNVSPDVLPESYRVKLKDPTQFAQVHDLFCSGTFNDRGKEICNPGIDSVIDQKKLVGLQDKTDRFPHELSGGEQQRVSIARAFVNRPLLMLCDEPTGNLDPTTSGDIMRLLERINRTGTTVVMATHDERIVDQMRKRVVELEHGKVVRDQERGVYDLGV